MDLKGPRIVAQTGGWAAGMAGEEEEEERTTSKTAGDLVCREL